jgi:SagB-type dehydrogenase family enzyme
VWTTPPAAGTIDFDALTDLISLGFGATGFLAPVTDAAPLLRRTSPSGGARHPSEGYVIVLDVPGVEPGWYHVTMQPFSLRRLVGRPKDPVELHQLFPQTFERFPLEVRCLIVVTSRFERNMYRYREPRTFRTVHMDAGHIAGTIKIAARARGLAAGISPSDRARAIESAIGIDGMVEGYMLTVALADGLRRSAVPPPSTAEHDVPVLEEGEVNAVH